jgi:L-threonylcarbamoyladenylate synthase
MIADQVTELLAADSTGIARAAARLAAGELVAFGTETVYGLGADATNDTAVAAIFAAKRRPHFNPLICHFPDAPAAWQHVVPTEQALILAAHLWPGPLTLVLPRRTSSTISLLAGAGLDSLAVRVPAHPTALAVLRQSGRPIAAPSANLSGQVSPTTAAHVLAGLSGRIVSVLDSGPCPVGVESTVLDLTGPIPILLRPGGATMEAIATLIGPLQTEPASKTLRSPGMLASHYAPDVPVRLDATEIRPHEALLAFGTPLHGASVVYNLSDRGDLIEAAARLFAGLRWLDEAAPSKGASVIAAMPIPKTGLGLAINDRLIRAAAPRKSV